MWGMRTHYDVLGVKHNASADEIGSAYRFLASKFHPDVNLGRESEARRRFLEVQEAFETLSDFQQRLRYDASIMPAPHEETKTATAVEDEPTPQPMPPPETLPLWNVLPMDDDFMRPVFRRQLRKRRRGYSFSALFFMACIVAAGAIIYMVIQAKYYH
jgi:curved DNA-binding protein CbpA